MASVTLEFFNSLVAKRSGVTVYNSALFSYNICVLFAQELCNLKLLT